MNPLNKIKYSGYEEDFFVTSSYPSHDIKFIKALIKKGLEISVFIIRPQTLTHEEKVDGAEYIYRKRNNFLSYNLDYLLSFFSLFFILKDRCNRDKPDVLHGGNIQTAGFLCSLIGFKPFLLMPYGSDALILPRKIYFLSLLTRYVVKASDSITCDANSVKKSLTSLTEYKNDILVFPWGVNQSIFNPSFKSKELKKKLGLEGKPFYFVQELTIKYTGLNIFYPQ